MLKIEEFNDKDIFLKYLASFDVSNNPYQSYAYYSVFLKYFGNNEYRFFKAVDSDNCLKAIIPLFCFLRLGNAELLRFIGYGQFNYEGYICRTDDIEEVHASFVEYIRTNSKKFVIDFFDINSSSKLFSCLNETIIPKTSIQLYGCPLVNFKEPEFDDFFKAAFQESKKRSELKKFQRKLETVGEVSIVNLYGVEAYESYSKYIPELYEIFSKRFKGVYATSFFLVAIF